MKIYLTLVFMLTFGVCVFGDIKYDIKNENRNFPLDLSFTLDGEWETGALYDKDPRQIRFFRQVDKDVINVFLLSILEIPQDKMSMFENEFKTEAFCLDIAGMDSHTPRILTHKILDKDTVEFTNNIDANNFQGYSIRRFIKRGNLIIALSLSHAAQRNGLLDINSRGECSEDSFRKKIEIFHKACNSLKVEIPGGGVSARAMPGDKSKLTVASETEREEDSSKYTGVEQILEKATGKSLDRSSSVSETGNLLTHGELGILLIIFTLIPIIFLCVQIRRKGLRFLFSISGRACRKTYWVWWFSTLPLFILFSLFFSYIGEIVSYLSSVGTSIYLLIAGLWILFIFVYIPYICVQIRRLHDMNISGYWYIIFFLINHTPLVFIKWLILGCVKGSKEGNRFGDPECSKANFSTKEEGSDIDNPVESEEQQTEVKIAEEPIILDKIETCNNSVNEDGVARVHKSEERSYQKAYFLFFLAGIILGMLVMYAISDRYLSYPCGKYEIVRIDKWTGKTDISSRGSAWREIEEGK